MGQHLKSSLRSAKQTLVLLFRLHCQSVTVFWQQFCLRTFVECFRVNRTEFVEFAGSLLKYRDVANCSGVCRVHDLPLYFPLSLLRADSRTFGKFIFNEMHCFFTWNDCVYHLKHNLMAPQFSISGKAEMQGTVLVSGSNVFSLTLNYLSHTLVLFCLGRKRKRWRKEYSRLSRPCLTLLTPLRQHDFLWPQADDDDNRRTSS